MIANDYLLELDRRFPPPASAPARPESYDWDGCDQPVMMASELSSREASDAAVLMTFEWSPLGAATVVEDYKWLLAFHDGRELIDFICIVGGGLAGSTEFGEIPETDDDWEDELDDDEEEQADAVDDEVVEPVVAEPPATDAEDDVPWALLEVWRYRTDALQALADGVNVGEAVATLVGVLGDLLEAEFRGPWTRDELLRGDADDAIEVRREFRAARQDNRDEKPQDAVWASGDGPILADEVDDFFYFLERRFAPG